MCNHNIHLCMVTYVDSPSYNLRPCMDLNKIFKRVEGNIYHFYRIEFKFLTDPIDCKKPCELKVNKYFCSRMQNLHVCNFCVYANHVHVYRVLVTGNLLYKM